MLDVGCWALDVGRWTLDVGRWTLNLQQKRMINNLTAEEVRALLKLEPHATIDLNRRRLAQTLLHWLTANRSDGR